MHASYMYSYSLLFIYPTHNKRGSIRYDQSLKKFQRERLNTTALFYLFDYSVLLCNNVFT